MASEVRSSMLALQDEYYEGRPWTNDNSYRWNGNNTIGYGCAAFAFILSDAAFGTLPARKYTTINYSDLRVGDILRINNDTHSVIITYKYDDHIVIAEGNYNSSIHWGRSIEKSKVEQADYYLTRYPTGSQPSQPETAPNITSQPVSMRVSENYHVEFTVVAENATSYQWYSRASSTASWSAVTENGTSPTYSFTAKLSHNGSQYRCLVSNAQDSVFSEAVTLWVISIPVITRHPASVSVNAGETATFSVTATGQNLKYKWYYIKPGESNLTPVSQNGTSATYSLVAQERHNGYMYCCEVYNENSSVYSHYATLTVGSSSQPAEEYTEIVANNGDTIRFGLQDDDQYTYQWYYMAPEDTEWTKLTPNGTSATITISQIGVEYNGYKYRCKVMNADGGIGYSSIFRLTVLGVSKPVITAHPSNQKMNEGAKATFKVVATDANSYQWYYQKPNNSTWNAVSNNGTSATYSLTTAARHNGYKYRVKVSNSAGAVWSNAATLTVNLKPVITTQPSSQKVNEGAKAMFKVVATGATGYQWYYQKSNDSTWYAVSNNGTSATYTLTTAARHNGYKYKVKVSNSAGYIWSNTVTLTVTTADEPTITTQPTNQTVNEGANVTFKVVASNAESYQWHYQKPNDSTWYAVSNNGTSATYSLTTAARHNGYKYRVKVSNSAGYVWSNTVTLTVNLKPVITGQPSNVSTVVGKTVTFKVTATGATSYQWYYQKPGETTWIAVTNNGTSATYTLTTAARHNGYKYKCEVKNAVGSVYSNIVTLTVK